VDAAKKKMHLVGFMLHCPMNHTLLSWAHPRDKVGYVWTEPEFWQEIARTLERGRFDCLFLADRWAAFDAYQGSMDATLRYALQFPIHDPLLLVPAMSVATERLGFAVTATTTYYALYMPARKLSTLDHLTKGRIGWNVVTSVHDNEARNFGLKNMLGHKERYARAVDFMEVCCKLWDSWESDVSMPQPAGTPEQVGDQMEDLMAEGGGDGFQITPTYTPGGFQEIVDGLAPVLQKRGLHRKEYVGKTLRGHLPEY
jgi:alkanesulfonate monooxygenase SsuD/methylene tetrahydromethanopterin reductase-like flavin-dependent oxidoreductase (luciferase family)